MAYLKKIFEPIDHHVKFNILKLNWTLFGALPKICDWIQKYVPICQVFSSIIIIL